MVLLPAFAAGPAFPIYGPYYQSFLSHGLCYRPITTSSFLLFELCYWPFFTTGLELLALSTSWAFSTRPFCYRPFTIGLLLPAFLLSRLCYWLFLILVFSASGLLLSAFLLYRPCYRPFLLYGSCYRPFCNLGLLLAFSNTSALPVLFFYT